MEIPGRVSAEIDSVGLAVAGEATTRPPLPIPPHLRKAPAITAPCAGCRE